MKDQIRINRHINKYISYVPAFILITRESWDSDNEPEGIIMNQIMGRQTDRGFVKTERGKIEHLASCFEKGIYLYIPPDYEEEFHKVSQALEKDPIFKPTYGPITYTGNSGIKCTTKYPIRIGSAYMLLLEKIADDGSAVSSGKLQTHGLLAKLSKLDKNAQPIKNQAVRAIGETEGRIIISYVGERATAEIMDRNNNPFSHKQVVYNIISADKPTDIDFLINRDTHPFGKTKPLELVKHIAQCAGYKYSYIKTV